MKILGNTDLYVKGTSRFTFFRADGSVRYWTDKLQTSQIQTSINLGAINGGAGNPVLINIPDTPDMSVDLTAANFSLEAQASNVGATIVGNSKVPFTEAITFGANGKATISGTPVAPLGSASDDLVGTIVKYDGKSAMDGVTFTKATSGNTYEFTYTGAAEGKSACVEYYIEKPEALMYETLTSIAPEIGRGVVRMNLYSAEVNSDPSKGTHVGYVYIVVPRMQWTGEGNIEGSSTNPSTTVVKAKALGAPKNSGSTGCTNDEQVLSYTVVELFGSDWTENAEKIICMENPLVIKAGAKKLLSCKYIEGTMVNNIVPAKDCLTFTSAAAAKAKVDASGLVEGVAAGETTITIAPKSTFKNPNKLSLTVNVTVEA